jgi:hypothetical protein
MKINKPAFLTTLMASAVFGGEFEPVTVTHSGTFDLDDPPEKAIYLFTAPGEVVWVPGWEPTILSGDGFEQGTVFLTGHGDESTIWVVVDFDTKAYRARYARITPASRAGTVEVRLHTNDSGGSTVEVSYELTALNESGNQNLAGFDDEAYAEMLIEWKTLVVAAQIDYQTLIPR